MAKGKAAESASKNENRVSVTQQFILNMKKKPSVTAPRNNAGTTSSITASRRQRHMMADMRVPLSVVFGKFQDHKAIQQVIDIAKKMNRTKYRDANSCPSSSEFTIHCLQYQQILAQILAGCA